MGEHFGEMALLNGYVTQSSVIAGGMICEVLFLSRARYRHTCRIHMSDEEYKWILAPASTAASQSQQVSDTSPTFVRNKKVAHCKCRARGADCVFLVDMGVRY